jgi:hypothetical protein
MRRSCFVPGPIVAIRSKCCYGKIGLTVAAPKSAKIGSLIAFKFKTSKASIGTCYANLAGKGVIGTVSIRGSVARINVKHSSPGAYNFICTGGCKWATDFVYLRVNF